MHFNILDAEMRRYETQHDRLIPQESRIVVRLDGRGFTSLTNRLSLAKPFDPTFGEWMRDLVHELMSSCGFECSYGYTESDEISLLLARNYNGFDRKERKLISVLAGEASARFTAISTEVGAFDARVCELPEDKVVDYFRWRQADAERNARNAYCYWTLRASGLSERKASAELLNKGVSYKDALLNGAGIDFYQTPTWERYGIGVRWEEYTKVGIDPRFGEERKAIRRRLVTLDELPTGEKYGNLVRSLL